MNPFFNKDINLSSNKEKKEPSFIRKVKSESELKSRSVERYENNRNHSFFSIFLSLIKQHVLTIVAVFVIPVSVRYISRQSNDTNAKQFSPPKITISLSQPP